MTNESTNRRSPHQLNLHLSDTIHPSVLSLWGKWMLTLPCREERAQLQCQLHIRGGFHHSRNNNEPFSRQWNAVIGGTCSKEGGFGCGTVILSLNPVQTGLIDPIKTSNPLACLRSPRPEAVILVTLAGVYIPTCTRSRVLHSSSLR